MSVEYLLAFNYWCGVCSDPAAYRIIRDGVEVGAACSTEHGQQLIWDAQKRDVERANAGLN